MIDLENINSKKLLEIIEHKWGCRKVNPLGESKAVDPGVWEPLSVNIEFLPSTLSGSKHALFETEYYTNFGYIKVQEEFSPGIGLSTPALEGSTGLITIDGEKGIKISEEYTYIKNPHDEKPTILSPLTVTYYRNGNINTISAIYPYNSPENCFVLLYLENNPGEELLLSMKFDPNGEAVQAGKYFYDPEKDAIMVRLRQIPEEEWKNKESEQLFCITR